MAIPISEVAEQADVTRQAVYKAILAGRLTEVSQLGKKGVKEDQKLRDFINSNLKKENGNGKN